MQLKLYPFRGLLPRSKSVNQATVVKAENVDLSDGTLRPWRELKQLSTDVMENGYFCECDVKPIERCQTITELKAACGFKVLSGKDEATLACNPCQPDQPLGVFYSDEIPTITVTTPVVFGTSEEKDRQISKRSYAYTYVDCYNREGLLSLKSDPIDCIDGEQVVVSGFTAPPSQHGIVKINIYRTATGYRSGSEEAVEDATNLFFVGSVDNSTTALMDSTPDELLGAICLADDNFPPDERLRGIKLYEPTNQLVGFFGTEVHFSAGNFTHIFPIDFKYDLRLQGDKITNILPYDEGVYVFTSYRVYFISNIVNELRTVYTVDNLELPNYVGTDDNSLMVTRFGVIYTSKEGLILATQGRYENLTLPWFTKNDWLKLKPDSIKLGFYEDHIFMSFADVTYLLHLSNEDTKQRELTTIPDKVNKFITSPNGELVLLKQDGVHQWDAGDSTRESSWELKIGSGKKVNLKRVQLESEGLPTTSINDTLARPVGDNLFINKSNHRKKITTVSIKSKQLVTDGYVSTSKIGLSNA